MIGRTFSLNLPISNHFIDNTAEGIISITNIISV